jgi:hypothetical protein
MQKIELTGLADIRGDWLSPRQVAWLLSTGEPPLNETTVRRWTTSKNDPLPHTNLGGRIQIPRVAFVQWLNRRSAGVVYHDPGYEPTAAEIYHRDPNEPPDHEEDNY